MTLPTTPTGEFVDVYVIGRCPVKGCKMRRRNVLQGKVMRRRNETWTSWGIPTEYGEQRPNPFHGYLPLDRLSVSRSVARWFSRGDATHPLPDQDPRTDPRRATSPMIQRGAELLVYTESMYALGWVCEDHDRYMKLNAVEGVVNEDRHCDGRCEAATGPVCECSCGGAGHGAAYDWMVTV